MKIPKKSSAKKASSAKLSPAQKAANTRKEKQIKTVEDILTLKSENIRLHDIISELQKPGVISKEIHGLAKSTKNKIETLELEKLNFLEEQNKKITQAKNEKTKYLDFLESEKSILS